MAACESCGHDPDVQDEIFDLLGKQYTRLLRKAEEDGEVVDPRHLSNAAKWLRDNKKVMTPKPITTPRRSESITDTLPFTDEVLPPVDL